VGRWYLVDTGTGRPLRARLALRLEDDRSLLFTNCSGARALRSGFADFSALVAEGRVKPLDCGCAFSRALAWAAGIESFEELEELTGAMAGIARQEAELRRLEAEEAERQKRLAEEARRRNREGDRLGAGE